MTGAVPDRRPIRRRFIIPDLSPRP